MAVLEPRLAILDETDSGLDIDALKVVAHGVNALRSPERAMIVVTHYQRLLNYIVPDFVHVLLDGRIVRSGGKELALELEEQGYDWLEEEPAARGNYSRACVLPGNCESGSVTCEHSGAAAQRTCAGSTNCAMRPWSGSRAGVSHHAERGVEVHQRGALLKTPTSLLPVARDARSGGAIHCRTRCLRLVFVNGSYCAGVLRAVPAGVGGQSAEALAAGDAAAKLAWRRYADYRRNAFAALNTALLRGRRFCRDAAGRRASRSRSFLCASPPDGLRLRTRAPSSLRVAAPGDHRGNLRRLGRRRVLHQRGDRVGAGEGAVVEPLQAPAAKPEAPTLRTAAGAAGARQQRSPRITSRSAAALARNDINAMLDGEGAECTLNGLYLTTGEQHVDNHTTLDHAKPHCPSHELYKGVLDGRSPGRVQRQDHRPAGRAEDRRHSEQQEPAALRRRRDQHQAAAGNLRRRREMHPRRDGRARWIEEALFYLRVARHRRGTTRGAADRTPSRAT